MKLCIRCKLILIVLTILVPLLIVSAYSYFMMIQKARHESAWTIRIAAEEIAKDLDDHFDKTFNVIDALSQHPSVKRMDPEACDRLFAKLLPSYNLHLNILAARPDGLNSGSAISPQDAHKLNYSDREWFKQSICGKRIIGNLHQSKLFKSSAIMMAGPVYGDGASIKGVIGLPLNLDKLRLKIVKDWQLPRQSIILVADAKGNLLVDTLHKEHVGENAAHFPIIQAARKIDSDYLEMSAGDGVKRLFYVTRPENTNWRILVGVPSVSIINKASLINNPYLFAIIITAILGLIISIMIARRLTGNISEIVTGIQAIGSGSLDYRLNLKGNDELADISGYFNEMAEKHQQYEREIKEMNSRLEQRVEERTAQLVAANKELDSFAYSVSHDLRAPLRGINGFNKLLITEHGHVLDSDGKELLERTRNACVRMDKLIEDLLEFSRVTRAELRKKRVNLSEMALNIAEELRETDPRREVEFRISPDISADVDPVLMRTVMENLFSNAWKFTRHTEKPLVVFDAVRENGSITCFVRDNGAGFNQEYAGKLFNVFQRLHTLQEFEGSGVGLASVKKIINRHGGEIWAEGKENEGATFYFRLPTAASRQDKT